MANFDLDEIQIHQDLAGYEDRRPVLHGHPDTDWVNDHFGKIPIWHVQPLDAAQMLAVGREWRDDIINSTISPRTVIKGLKLALSIRSMIPNRNNPLMVQQARGVEANDQLSARVNIPAINLFSAGIYHIRAIQGDQVLPVVINPAAQVEGPVINDTEKQETDSYCFLAFFMMRLLVKSPLNVTNAVHNMKTRYASFYGPSRAVTNFNMTVPKATAYKEALLGQDYIGLTFTHALANTQQYHLQDMTPNESGVLSYLGMLPLSYSGMHCYTLMLELKTFTNTHLGHLLSAFYCNATAKAINKIAHIVNTYERTDTNPERPILFRYCTLWGPSYFSAVRSKNSIHLLYTVACAWNVLNQGKENADPENIAAIESLPNTMKQTLKAAGIMIGDALKRKMLGGPGASTAYNLAIQRQEDQAAQAAAHAEDEFEEFDV